MGFTCSSCGLHRVTREGAARRGERLCTARENEEEIDRIFLENRNKSLSLKEQLETLATQAVEGGCLCEKGWKLVTASNRGEVPTPPAELQFSKGIVPQA